MSVQIIVRSPNVPVSKALEEHCERRVQRAVKPFADQVRRVEVVMVDVNGPRKGLGQVCRVFIELTSGRHLMSEGNARDFYSAASQATFGTGHRLARLLARSRSATHARLPPPDAA